MPASRAGGFAVVAGEVRSLAQRSAGAAKEIKELITASVERVEDGAQLADRAGSTMTEVVGSIRRVTDIMGEISAASSSEQSAGVAQVGEAVTQMDQTTQQNAALVEEMAAAASSLRSQAQDLVQAVSVFRLASDTPRAEPVEVTAPTAVTVAPAPSPAPAVAAPRPSMPARRKSPAKMPSPARTPSLRPAAAGAGFMAVPAMAAQGGQGDWESF